MKQEIGSVKSAAFGGKVYFAAVGTIGNFNHILLSKNIKIKIYIHTNYTH